MATLLWRESDTRNCELAHIVLVFASVSKCKIRQAVTESRYKVKRCGPRCSWSQQLSFGSYTAPPNERCESCHKDIPNSAAPFEYRLWRLKPIPPSSKAHCAFGVFRAYGTIFQLHDLLLFAEAWPPIGQGIFANAFGMVQNLRLLLCCRGKVDNFQT